MNAKSQKINSNKLIKYLFWGQLSQFEFLILAITGLSSQSFPWDIFMSVNWY